MRRRSRQRPRVTALAGSARALLARHPRRAQAVAVWIVAGLAGAVMWSAALDRGGSDEPPSGIARPLGPPGVATSVALDPRTAWTVSLRDRLVRSVPLAADGPPGESRLVGSAGDLPAHVTVGQGAVWVALRQEGRGAVVRLERQGGARRVLSTGDQVPDRIVVLPARVVMVGDSRIAAVPTGRSRGWSHALPDAVDVASGYGSVWSLSRLPNARSLVARRDPATGRVTGRRVVPAAATAIDVGLGAVWVANGCADGVLRAPVGPGPATCTPMGKGAADVAVGGGSAWAADAARTRVVELDGVTGSVVQTWEVPGRPTAVAVAGDSAVTLTQAGRLFRLIDPADL